MDPELAVPVKTAALLRDVFNNDHPHLRRQMRGRQHALDDRRRKAGALVVTFEDRPSGAARQSEHLGLLVERDNARRCEGLAELPDLGYLSGLHLRHAARNVGARRLRMGLRPIAARQLGMIDRHLG